MPVNYVLLTVISGIIGLVLTGFTAWHMSLAWRGQTTIECLEKTRYLSPLRKSMQHQHYQQNYVNGADAPTYGQQLRDIHANALPGVTRPEEGEERASPTVNSSRAERLLHRTYNDLERSRERHRYEDYLDEQDSEKLPNAFDLGWRQNMKHLFGENPALWFLPICNTTGDGWHWEASPKWVEVREEIRRERRAQWRDEHNSDNDDDWGNGTVRRYPPSSFQPSEGRERQHLPQEESSSLGTSDRRTLYNGNDAHSLYANQPIHTERPRSGMSMQTLHSSHGSGEEDGDDPYEISSDEEESDERALRRHEGGGWGRHKVTGSQSGQGKRLLRKKQRSEDDWHDWGASGDHHD
ncbi:MAG: palmitoyltransferase for Vac8p [Candelina mexicana]|nr:MAG: palmitoyltransferase for Vac8p [Candelina mexicana]